MIRNSGEKDIPSKQETDERSSSSKLWPGLRNPRIVRVSRAFGGKDRHSKVSTVRGLRDRRVRLSVPTAIQLYDLQDRLGLNQPSKVVDWLLNAAQHEIDKLPPLQMPPGNFIQFNATDPPAIKLFGQSIVPPEEQPPPDFSGAGAAAEDVCAGVKNKEFHALKPDAPKEVDQNEPANSSGASNSNEDDHHMSTVDANNEQDRAVAETSNQEKALKKPDKILPCPRCKSLDTKFCYFNNYNVNQPRHFCKNCHRYWTAGGTMRNVPVGAGKRKSKVSTSHHHHTMMVADGMPLTDSAGSVALSGASSVHLRPLKEKAPVQSFRPEAPVSESVVSVQADQKRNTEIGSCGENKNESLCLSSLTDSHHVEDDSTVNTVPNGQSAIHHLPCYPGPPFVFPWSPGCNSAAAMAAGWCSSDVFNGSGNGNSNPVAWSQPPTFPSAFCAPNFAFPLMPASFWGCMSSWPTGAWNIPWIGSNGHVTPSLSTRNSDSATTLGKHYRDAPLEGEGERRTKSLWVPKTLRIDDPDEAVKSSIWDTLGIKPEKSISKGSVFKAFQSKTGTKAQTTDATKVLHANPVALCRSQKFQESN